MVGRRLFPFGARPLFRCELLVSGRANEYLNSEHFLPHQHRFAKYTISAWGFQPIWMLVKLEISARGENKMNWATKKPDPTFHCTGCSIGILTVAYYHSLISGQIIIFHQPRFPWNKKISLPKPPLGVRSCKVAIIWPAYIPKQHCHHKAAWLRQPAKQPPAYHWGCRPPPLFVDKHSVTNGQPNQSPKNQPTTSINHPTWRSKKTVRFMGSKWKNPRKSTNHPKKRVSINRLNHSVFVLLASYSISKPFRSAI